MSEVIKLGPFWNRAVFDPDARVVKYRGRTVCRFDEIKQLRVREYINRHEEEQLLNANVEVQKMPRDAELWVDTKDGRSARVATMDQAGLLLAAVSELAGKAGVPITTERTLIAASSEKAPRAT
jgi:hypothetical protein